MFGKERQDVKQFVLITSGNENLITRLAELIWLSCYASDVTTVHIANLRANRSSWQLEFPYPEDPKLATAVDRFTQTIKEVCGCTVDFNTDSINWE